MLYLQDSFVVIGERQFDFEDAVRDVYAPTIADVDTRLLTYHHAVHGSAEGYYVALLTAVRDGAALDRLAARLRHGDLATYSTQLATMSYWRHSSLLVSAEWSGGPEPDLAAIPVTGADHPTALFREDAFKGRGINAALAAGFGARSGDHVLTFEAAYRPALAADTAARVLYRINDVDAFTDAWRTDTGWTDWTGSLNPRLPENVRVTGRYLRSAPWSPVP